MQSLNLPGWPKRRVIEQGGRKNDTITTQVIGRRFRLG